MLCYPQDDRTPTVVFQGILSSSAAAAAADAAAITTLGETDI